MAAVKGTYELIHRDCIDLDTASRFSLVYTDPPYGSRVEDEYYGEGNNLEEFLVYMEERLVRVSGFMTADANILVHVDYKAVHYLKVLMDKIFGRENFRNEIIWGFSNPARTKRWLPRKHQTLLWYGLGNYVFNQPRVPYNGKLNVGGKTSWAGETKDASEYEAKGKLLEDWWTDIPALCRNESEKTGYATQKPLALMKRVLEIWSNESDSVLDPFMGSGSFIDAAVQMGRHAVGVDKSEVAHEMTKKRLVGKSTAETDIFNDSI